MLRTGHRIRRIIIPILLIAIVTTIIITYKNGVVLRRVWQKISFHGLPGAYLSSKTANASYCNFRYGLPEELLYEENDLKYPHEEQANYRILPNVVNARLDETVPQVTYATHATADFVNYISEVIKFWEGPLSVAVFVPDYDADVTLTQLNQLCQCTPDMSRVSVHFIFPLKNPPYMQNHPKKHTCLVVDSSKLATFRTETGLTYPINICRNVARNNAQTKFVMVTDIQLIPSEKLASRFMKMIGVVHNTPSRVFVVPVFEVEAYDVMPKSKNELLMMVREERAAYFHRAVCSHCQKFPDMKTWLQGNVETLDIKPFLTVRRETPFHRWEPIYIGSKDEPNYSEQLSWEGLQDKMTQMLEMCLRGYQFVVLDNAFLVHWPGIKKDKDIHHLKNSWRIPFLEHNSKVYAEIVARLRDQYGDNPKCKL